jgi:hypothetical protein
MKSVSYVSFILSGLLSFFLFSYTGYSQIYISVQINQAQQLQADAGAHKTICIGDSTLIGGVPAAIHGTPPYSFSWTPVTALSNPGAANPLASSTTTTAYLLTVTDSLGCTAMDSTVVTVDSCIGIADIRASYRIDIFPNPNNGFFTIAVESDQILDNVTVDLINKLGQVVYSQKENNSHSSGLIEINAHNLTKGLYFVLIREKSIWYTGKVIID